MSNAELRMCHKIHRQALVVSCCLSLALVSIAQTAGGPAPAPPVSYSSINELNQILENLQQASQSTLADPGHLRIDKWKTDSGTKRQTEADDESIQKNLQIGRAHV